MVFNSTEFIIFFPIVVFVYYILPHKIRYIWLLAASYYFYMNWNPIYILLLFSCTLVTYLAGLILERLNNIDSSEKRIKTKRRFCMIVCLLVNLGILGFFKYGGFILLNINKVLSIIGVRAIIMEYSVILPVGISFYTLQAIGYLIDVYRGDTYAEKNFFRYALFISFFPQLVAGPIERSKNLLKQLYVSPKFNWENFRQGFILMLWGFFLKVVIADRAAIIVNAVYDNPEEYKGFFIIVATFFFAAQVYCDFYGYSEIARGAARFFGIKLMDNFNAPYFSQSVKEFWRRWHISLASWFRDYLYIPLGGNRNGALKKQRNLLIVFAVSGLWHGASFAYIAWGLLNGIYQVAGDCLKYIKEKLFGLLKIKNMREDCFSRRLLKRTVTFLLLCFALVFFRAGNMPDALHVLKCMAQFDWLSMFSSAIYDLGVSKEYFHVLLAAIVVLGVADYQKYRGIDMTGALLKQEWWFRFLVEMALLFTILMLGCYGAEYDTSEFIYFQF